MLAARRTSRLRRACTFAGVLVGALVGASAAQPVAPSDSLVPSAGVHPLGIRDLWAFERVSDPQPSPNGEWVAYVRRAYDAKANTSYSNLWLVSAEGGASQRLTTARALDTQPRWAPNGRSIAFLSDRGGKTQIWSLDVAGGEPRVLVELPVDVESFQWSPTGDRLCFAAGTYPDCADLNCTAERRKKLEDSGMTARIYDDLLFRHWDSWDSGRRSHLFVVPVAGGKPMDLTPGADLDTPPLPSGGVEAYAWSPDGKGVAFQVRRRDATAAWSTNLDIYVAATDGSGSRCITESNLAEDSWPVFGPDGNSFAYLAMARPGYEADRKRVTIYEPASSRRRTLTETWDRSASELVWSKARRRLFAVAPDNGTRRIFAIHTISGTVTRLDLPGSVTSLRVARGKDERIVYVGESLTAPHEIFSCTPDGGDVRQLTTTNAERLAAVRMSQPEEVWYTGAGGARVHAWLHPPVDRREGVQYPLLVLVHGGPQGSWENRFNYRWNPQVWAGAGYAVLAPDPRGSIGYGQEFTDAIRNDWGGKCYEDIMLGVEHVVTNNLYIDGTRVAAAGGSFGGYMTLWMAGQTDRFRCLVNHAGLFDLESFYASTEEQWFPEWDFGGLPWEVPEAYEKWSPSKFVDRWKTPMLVTHGGRDYRVPEAQGFAAYTTLQRRGIASQLLHYPDEHHWILKSRNSILWYDTVIAWLDRWCKNTSARPGQP